MAKYGTGRQIHGEALPGIRGQADGGVVHGTEKLMRKVPQKYPECKYITGPHTERPGTCARGAVYGTSKEECGGAVHRTGGQVCGKAVHGTGGPAHGVAMHRTKKKVRCGAAHGTGR